MTPPRAPALTYELDTTSSSPKLPTHHVMAATRAATLDLPTTKLPLLHKGDTTQSQLHQLEVHCANYFLLKTIAADKQVANIISCFHDYCITTWLENDAEHAAAIALNFKAFIAKIWEHLLPTDWECTIKQDMHSRKQGKSKTFLTFLTIVEHANSLLINTLLFLDEAHICTLLESNMLIDLSDDLADDSKAADEKDYKKWCDIVKRKDNVRIHNIARLNKTADDRAKREPRTTNTVDEHPQKRNKHKKNAAPPPASTSGSGSTASTVGAKHCPKLTDEERNLLTANHGCMCWHVPFVEHGNEHEKTSDLYSWRLPSHCMAKATVDAAATLTAEQRTKDSIRHKPAPAAGGKVNPNTVTAIGFAEVEDPDDSVDSTVSEPHLYWDFHMEGPMSNLLIHTLSIFLDSAAVACMNPYLSLPPSPTATVPHP
ncbi:hypothetical protein K438DRAFT_1964141 [Mycena galopus ATCC 62051]|nr:hypothetical protein K438DRAFT_1964141 [Mycena galopus ATCC 62051]